MRVLLFMAKYGYKLRLVVSYKTVDPVYWLQFCLYLYITTEHFYVRKQSNAHHPHRMKCNLRKDEKHKHKVYYFLFGVHLGCAQQGRVRHQYVAEKFSH